MTGDFQYVIDLLGEEPEVGFGKMFGSVALKVRGKVFSMCVKDKLVVKLPAARVKQLIDRGLAMPFDPGHGRVMKEWVSIAPGAGIGWVEVSSEAKAFVAQSAR